RRVPLFLSCRLATAESFTGRTVDSPDASVKGALPMTARPPPRRNLALSFSVPLQRPPEQVSLTRALPPLTLATVAAVAVPPLAFGGSSGPGGLELAVKVAVTATAVSSILTMQEPVPEQPSPDQPAKVEPEAAVAFSVTSSPCV